MVVHVLAQCLGGRIVASGATLSDTPVLALLDEHHVPRRLPAAREAAEGAQVGPSHDIELRVLVNLAGQLAVAARAYSDASTPVAMTSPSSRRARRFIA